MNRTEIKADDPLTVGDITLIPVVEVHSFSNVQGERAAFAAKKKATAVVALGPWGAMALSAEGEEVSLPELLNEVSGLRELVAGIGGSEPGTEENKG